MIVTGRTRVRLRGTVAAAAAMAILASIAHGIGAAGRPIAVETLAAIEGAAAPLPGRVWTADRSYRVSVEVAGGIVPLGLMHEWTLTLEDRAGLAASDCSLTFDGTMPEHGHGLPTAPRVSAGPRPGQYLVQGVRFSMPGRWRLEVVIGGAACAATNATIDLSL